MKPRNFWPTGALSKLKLGAGTRSAGVCLAVAVSAIAVVCGPSFVAATEVILNDGRTLSGEVVPIPSMVANPNAPANGNTPILLCDDELRRVFVPRRQVARVNPGGGAAHERFKIDQPVSRNGAPIAAVGPIIEITPFDKWGRRIFRMSAGKGPVSVIQGITDVTPTWTRVQALGNDFKWDMRIATSSIPRDTLDKVLGGVLDSKNFEDRLRLVRFYIQSERYEDSRATLDQALKDFPERGEDMVRTVRDLRQLSARRLVNEITLRRDGGQHRLAYAMLDKFPAEDVAGEILQGVQSQLDDYKRQNLQGQGIVAAIDSLLNQFDDEGLKKKVKPVRDEILAELNLNTLDRMAAFQLQANGDIPIANKLSLCLSGWIVGSDDAQENLAVTISLYEIRELIRQYMRVETKLERDLILKQLESQEGATPQLVSRIISHMRPPLETEPQAGPAGEYQLSVPGLSGDSPITYYVQLPPEYDPYRKYPAVVTLHGANTQPQHQLDWWSGAVDSEKNTRRGQAMRQGYIIIAPAWGTTHQRTYEYSAREHLAVVNSLRDAARRFSIDTDRVYLSGHSMGGDAAWDIGLAHPDLWAGVIPIVAISDKYCNRYHQNADYLPFYIVGGELDGDKFGHNATDLDRYMKYGYPVTVVEYQGRGHEHFSDEILHVFDWMKRQKRDFFPREFECNTMRPWDNFFWWIDVDNLPQRAMVMPYDWPPPRGTIPATVAGTINTSSSISVKTAGNVTLWLSPEMVSFDDRIVVNFNGRSSREVKPDVAVVLEDVRTRGDRQHPFWAKVSLP